MTVDRGDDHFYGSIRVGDGGYGHDGHRGSRGYSRGYGRYGNRHYDGHGYYSRHYRPYGLGHYYRGYSPIYWPHYGYYYRTPSWGYTYASVYYYEPYVASIYDDTVYYVVRDYDEYPESTTYIIDGGSTTYTSAGPSEQAPVSTYAGQAQPSQYRGAVEQPVEQPGEQYAPLEGSSWGPVLGEGNAAFASGRYEDARRLYVQAVFADERDGYAKMLYAWANFALGDFEVAATAVRRALLTSPDLMEFPIDVRTLYLDRLVFEFHVSELARHTVANPEGSDAVFLLSYLYYSVGEPGRAAVHLAALSHTAPTDTLVGLLYDATVRADRSPAAD